MKRMFQILAAGLALFALHAQAAEIVVSQKNKDFSQKSVKLKVGDSISFRNDDPFFHNVFSLSDAASFDLGSYPQGQSKSVKFTKAGTVEIECSIHPNMKLVVEVQ
jgi:plastocyanin